MKQQKKKEYRVDPQLNRFFFAMLIVDMILNTSHHLNDHEIEFGFVVNWIQKRYKHINHIGSNA